MTSDKNLGAIVLAAGKGKRMKLSSQNKVILSIGNKPMIIYTIELLERIAVSTIIVVVGHFMRSVMKVLQNKKILYAVQKKHLGTAHAVLSALQKLPKNITDVLVLQGDDSAFYTKDTIVKLVDSHRNSGADVTFLTINLDDPTGLGRIVRNANGEIMAIIEEKDANYQTKTIKEINPALYVFKITFLNKYLPKVKKSSVTGEYYLTSLIDIAIKNHKKIETLRGGKIPWRGVNTREELKQAEQLFLTTRSSKYEKSI